MDIHHFSRFCDKNGRFSIKNEANFLIRLNRFAANHSYLLCSDDSRKSFRRRRNGIPTALERCSGGLGTAFRQPWNGVPAALEWRSGGLGTAFRRPRNGRGVHSRGAGNCAVPATQSCRNNRNSGGSGNIIPLPPPLLPLDNTFIHSKIAQKVVEVVI